MMKKGFTLIELVVVLGIFGILMVAGTEFFIQVIKNGNQATMQNEVRQEANKIMQDIVNEVRKGTSLGIYSVDTTTGIMSKKDSLGIDRPISSNSVAVLNCSGTGCQNCNISGFQINGSTITLTVQQAPRFVRSDFCARVQLTQTVTSRVY